MGKSSGDSDSNSESSGSKPTNISPSIGTYSKAISDLFGYLLSKISRFLCDKSLDSDSNQLLELNEAITNLGEDGCLMTSLRTALVKLRKKQEDIEGHKTNKGNDTRSPLSTRPAKRRKTATVQLPPPSKLDSIPKIIVSLAEFITFFEVKAKYLSLQSLEKEDLKELYHQSTFANAFIEDIQSARQKLAKIVARMKGVPSTDANPGTSSVTS